MQKVSVVMLLILLWMGIFAAVHSLTADKRFKQAVRQRVGDPIYHGLYRLFYNIVTLLLLAPLFVFMGSISVVLYRIPQPIAALLMLVQLIGGMGIILSIWQIDLLRFAGLRQMFSWLRDQPLPLPDETLQTGGLYGRVRHPLYISALLVLWFTPVMTHTTLIFNIAATLYFIFGSRIEERRLLDVYGETYANYQQRVPWMIPKQRAKS